MGPTANGMTCSDAMQRFNEVLDGELMDATQRTGMERHLASCTGCAEKATQLREMQDVLRGLAESPLPDEALKNVWSRTVESPADNVRRFRFNWRFAAAAAAVLFVAWVGLSKVADERAEAERMVAIKATEEVRMVLQLAANAMKRTERVAFKEVFTEEISPALRKVGVKWPQARNGAAGQGADL